MADPRIAECARAAEVDPETAKAAQGRYGCLSPWQSDPARYGRAVLYGQKKPCDQALLDQLSDLLNNRLAYMEADGGEAYFDAVQNARIVRAAEHYYWIMYEGSTESWNLRDRHMFETLQAVLVRRGNGTKAVVWAHNSHIGNAAATAMGWQGEFNIGELCRTAYRDEAVLIGFGTDGGTVAAVSDWDEPMEIKFGATGSARQPRARLPRDRHRALAHRLAAPRSPSFAGGYGTPTPGMRHRRGLPARD